MKNVVIMELVYFCQIYMYEIGGRALFGLDLRKKKTILFLGSLLCLCLLCMAETDRGMNIVFVIRDLLVMSLSIVWFEGEIKRKCIAALSIFSVSACLNEVFGVVLESVVSIQPYWERMYDVGEILCTTISLFLLGKIKKKMQQETEKLRTILKNAAIYIVFLMGICQAIAVEGLLYARKYLPTQQIKTAYEVMGIVSFVAIAGVILFVIYIRTANEQMEKLLMTEYDLQKMQKQYYTLLLNREADTKKYRHDMKNHLLCLYAMAENGDRTNLQSYIKEMQNDFDIIDKRCYVTGNEILDILLNYHLTDLQDTKIIVTGRCSKITGMNDMELCTIFSNIIQNAVEELKRQEKKEKYIKVIVKQGRHFVSVKVANSSDYMWNEKNETRKKDKRNHGFGLENVKEAIGRNGGEISFLADGKEVSVEVILPL